LSDPPHGELGPPLLTVSLSVPDSVVTLHTDRKGVLWLRDAGIHGEVLERADSVTVVVRSADREHFLIAGDFGRLRLSADVVIFEDSHGGSHDAETCPVGWLVAVPSHAEGTGTLRFMRDGALVARTQIAPLGDAGGPTPTFYARILDDPGCG
jgi:hypothetical protein